MNLIPQEVITLEANDARMAQLERKVQKVRQEALDHPELPQAIIRALGLGVINGKETLALQLRHHII